MSDCICGARGIDLDGHECVSWLRLRVIDLQRELDQAKERERQLREALTSIHQRWVDGPAEWHMMAWAMNSDAEAALTVPPARHANVQEDLYDDKHSAMQDEDDDDVPPAKEKP